MKAKDWLIFVLLGAIWSSSFMWIKIAVEEIGPITLVAFRVLFGLLFGIAVILVTRQKLSSSFGEWRPLLLLGITNVAIPFFLISWGEQVIDSAVAAILDATVRCFTIVIARDDRSTCKGPWIAHGFAGVVNNGEQDLGGSAGSFRPAAVVLASVFYAGSSVCARSPRRMRRDHAQR
jgi:drug/metabolite transporter (DMT)-like permease